MNRIIATVSAAAFAATCAAYTSTGDFAYVMPPEPGTNFTAQPLPIADACGFVGATDATHPSAIIGGRMASDYLEKAKEGGYRIRHGAKAACMELISALTVGPYAPSANLRTVISPSDLTVYDRAFLRGESLAYNFGFTNSYYASMVSASGEIDNYVGMRQALEDFGCDFGRVALSYSAPTVDYRHMSRNYYPTLLNALENYSGGWMDLSATFGNTCVLTITSHHESTAYDVPWYYTEVSSSGGKTVKTRVAGTPTHHSADDTTSTSVSSNRAPTTVSARYSSSRYRFRLCYATGWNVDTGKFTSVGDEEYGYNSSTAVTTFDSGTVTVFTGLANSRGIRNGAWFNSARTYVICKVMYSATENGETTAEETKYFLCTVSDSVTDSTDVNVTLSWNKTAAAVLSEAIAASGFPLTPGAPQAPAKYSIEQVTTDDQSEPFDLTASTSTSVMVEASLVAFDTFAKYSPQSF